MDVATLSEAIPISIDRDVMSGTPVFQGTRVPVRTLFDYVADGSTLDEFLENFPTVRRDQALKVLEFVSSNLVIGVPSR